MNLNLEAYCDRKSFYGKAGLTTKTTEDNKLVVALWSYGIPILSAVVDPSTDKVLMLKKYYDGWTQTTGRHLKAFYNMLGLEYSKKGFESLPYDEYINL